MMAKYKGEEINLTPTETMAKEAQRGLDFRNEYGRGGTEVGIARARDISNRKELSPSTVRRMVSFFARHEVDKKAEGFSPGEDGYPSNGKIAWLLWGGDSGKAWAEEKDRVMDGIDERMVEELEERSEDQQRPYPNEHAARLTDPDQYDSIRRINDEGGKGIDFLYGIKDNKTEIQSIRFDASQYSPDEAKTWLSEHDFSPIKFEEATGNSRMTEKKFYRSAQISDPVIDDRKMQFSFSSENPVERSFGYEVLAHDGDAADLSRLNDGAPLLFNHRMDDYIGVVERAWVDPNTKKGYVEARFATHERAQQIYQDAKDGILRNVSFAYDVKNYNEEPKTRTFTATNWMAYEVSLVTVPADQTVGLGRTVEQADTAETLTQETQMSEEKVEVVAEPAAPKVDPVIAERQRVAEIQDWAKRFGAEELGRELVNNGTELSDARLKFLERMENVKPVTETPEIGLSQKEIRQFSFIRAINAMANSGDRKAQEAAAFEREVSEAAQSQYQRSAQGFMIPFEVLASPLKRDLNVTTATAGGNSVATDLLAGSFIDLLRNKMALQRLGIQTMNGLVGNVAIPRQTGGATAYWVAESGSPTESAQTIDQVTMTPKTVGAFTDYSRKLLLQSSLDVENFVRNDLSTILALEVDRAGLYGSGASNQPTGLKGTTGVNTVDLAGATPTFAEVVSMETAVAADNADVGNLKYLMNATGRGGLKSAEKATNTGMFIFENNSVNGYGAEVSNQVESGDFWFGNWADMMLGFWSGIDLLIDPYTGGTSGTVRVIVHQDVDVAARHGESFCRANNTLA